MITLSEASTHLSRYTGVGNTFAQRINMVQERLTKSGNWRGTKERVSFTVYADSNGQAVITLPRKFNTVLAGNYVYTDSSASSPVRVRNSWYEFLPDGVGVTSGLNVDSFIPLEGRYCVFADWVSAVLLRFKFEQSETAGTIIIRGTLGGEKIYSTSGANWIEGIALAYSGSDAVTTTQQFDLPPYRIIKPVTKGRVSMYTVDGSGNERLVAVYDPTETIPAWRRYRVPSCISPTYVLAQSDEVYTTEEIDALFGRFAVRTVASSVSETLAPSTPYYAWYQKIVAQAGVGSYTATFSVVSANAKPNARFRFNIQIAASANPIIQIVFSGTTVEIRGDSSNALSYYLEIGFDGTNWSQEEGYYL